MYGKLFAQMYDGTLGTLGPWEALVTFQQLIILADKHGVVDMTAEAIARRTTIPLDVIRRGIVALQKPDPQSRTPDEDGRRIAPLADSRAWGWRIVNYGKYRKIRTADERREYLRQYQKERRAKMKIERKQNVNKSTADNHEKPIAVSSIANAEAEAFNILWHTYPKRAGSNSRAAALKAYRTRLASGVAHDDMLAGVERYAAFVRATGKEGTEYVKQAATFLGSNEHWAEPWDLPANTASQKVNQNVASITEGLLRYGNGE